MIINQELNRDYNLMEKITSRLENDLRLLTKRLPIQQYSPTEQVFVPACPAQFKDYIAYYIKLIDGPFFRKIRSNTAPILSRKFVDS